MWDIENELPDELIDTSIDTDLPQSSQSSTPQNLFNGSNETAPVEGSVVPQRHQQLSQLLQAKTTQQSLASLSASQRIPSPSVTSIASVKSPLANNASLNKPGTPVSAAAHNNVSDVSIALSSISNSTVNSLTNTSGTMGMNSNMLLMQNKGGAIGSQGNLVSLPTSVANNSNTNNLQHPVTVLPPQVSQQQNASTHMNGNLMSLGSVNTLKAAPERVMTLPRGVNPNISSAVLTQHPPHPNLLGHPLTNQGATLKVNIISF